MIEVQVSEDELTRVRFVKSALWEITSSLRALRHPRWYPLHTSAGVLASRREGRRVLYSVTVLGETPLSREQRDRRSGLA